MRGIQDNRFVEWLEREHSKYWDFAYWEMKLHIGELDIVDMMKVVEEHIANIGWAYNCCHLRFVYWELSFFYKDFWKIDEKIY